MIVTGLLMHDDGSLIQPDDNVHDVYSYTRFIMEKYERAFNSDCNYFGNAHLKLLHAAEYSVWDPLVVSRCSQYASAYEMAVLERDRGTEEGEARYTALHAVLAGNNNTATEELRIGRWATGLSEHDEARVVGNLGHLNSRKQAVYEHNLIPQPVSKHRADRLQEAVYKIEQYEKATTTSRLLSGTVSLEEKYQDLFMRQAMWRSIDEALDEVSFIDEYAQLGYEKWVTEGKLPHWHWDVPWIKGFAYPNAPTRAEEGGRWADEMDGFAAEPTRLEACTRISQHYDAMRKLLDYKKAGRTRTFEGFASGLVPSETDDVIAGAGMEDPEKRHPLAAETTTFAKLEAVRFDLNKMEDRPWMASLNEGVMAALSDHNNMPDTHCNAADDIDNGAMVLVKVMGMLSVHLTADAARAVSQLRKKIIKKFARRGLKVLGVAIRIPAQGEKLPSSICFEIELEMSDAARQWIQGGREIYFGDPAEGEQSRLWGIPQPREQVFVRLKGKGLSRFFRTLHHSNPEVWTDRNVSLLTTECFRDNNLRGVGILMCDPTHVENNKTKFMAFFDPDSTYNLPMETEQLARSLVESMAREPVRLFVGADEIDTPLYCDVTGEMRKETTEWALGAKLDAYDHLYPVSVFPMEVSDREMVETMRAAVGSETTMRSTIERLLLEKLKKEVPFCEEALVAILCGEAISGHWNKSWIILYFQTLAAARMFYSITNVRKISPDDLWRPGNPKIPHPYMLSVDSKGVPIVRARHDLLAPISGKKALKSTSTGLYAIMTDASAKHFVPPIRTQGVWMIPPYPLDALGPAATGDAGATILEGDDAEPLYEFKWNHADMGQDINTALDSPDAYDPRKSFTDGMHLTNKQIKDARKMLCKIMRAMGSMWVPAPKYGGKTVNPLSASITPSKDCKAADGRLCTLDYPELAELMEEKELFYTALSMMAIPNYVTIHNKDKGWVITANMDKLPMDDGTTTTTTTQRKPSAPVPGAGRGNGMRGNKTQGPQDSRGYLGGFRGRGQHSYENAGIAPRASGGDAAAARLIEAGGEPQPAAEEDDMDADL